MLVSSHHTFRAALGLVALAGALVALGSPDALAQKATNVDCSKCVDTGDIAKKAVDKKKLAKGAVDSSRIADGAVKAKDLADGAVEVSKLADGSVSSAKLADGAVTGAKLAANAVDGSKLADGAVSNSKIADGAVTMEKLAPDAVFGRIIVVRADPLDPVDNCDALLAALAGITDNDADNRYLIHLEPGVYDCGATPVEMKAYVDLQGAGRDVTLITGSVEGAVTGTVLGASDAELRQLSVENADVAAGTAIALYAGTGITSFRVTDVSAVARDSELPRAIQTLQNTVVLTNVAAETINATGNNAIVINIVGIGAVAELVNVTAQTDDSATTSETAVGIANQLTARNSVFISRSSRFNAAVNTGSGAIVELVSTQLDGTKGGTGTFKCVGAYDGAFIPLDNACDLTP